MKTKYLNETREDDEGFRTKNVNAFIYIYDSPMDHEGGG